MKLQKITSIFLAVVLVTGTITLGISVLVDDAFASKDRYMQKNHDREYDSYDKEPKNKKHNSYKVDYPKDKNFVIVLNNTLINNYKSIESPEYPAEKNSYDSTAYPAEQTSYDSTAYPAEQTSYDSTDWQ